MESAELRDFLATKIEDLKDVFQDSVTIKNIYFSKSEIGIDWTYAMMHLVAQKFLLSIRQKEKDDNILLDVASQFQFVSFASSFYQTIYLESRTSKSRIFCENVCDMTGISCEAQSIPVYDQKIDVITSLHAIEHFGLGRYGDTLDYFGDQKAIKEFNRVLRTGGHLITGVPAAKISKLEFNGERIYNPADYDDMVITKGFSKEIGVIVYPPNSRPDGKTIGDFDSLNEWPTTHTPPVYLAVYKKE